MGGSSSSSSSSTNQTTNHNSSVGVDGDNTGLILSNVSGSTITVTDHNAIKEAMALANNTLEVQQENYETSVGFVREVTGQYIEANSEIINESYEAINDNLNQSLAFVNTQNSPDGGLTVEIIKPLVYGSAAIAAAYLLARSVK